MKLCGSMLALPFFAVCVSALAASADSVPSQPITQASTVRNKPTDWNQQAAAKYLDDRMDLWFEKARKLRTGQGNTSCVSCHMTVPYALARPALRKAAGVSQPTPQEAKLLDETLRRVDTYGSHEPLSKSRSNHVHHFRIEKPEDLDEQLCGFIEQAYRVGQQKHLKSHP